VIEFAHSLRRLQADEGRATFWTLAASGLVLAGWILWATLSRVSIFEVTPNARVELEGATFPVESRFAGQVVRSRLHIGDHVRKGDVLVELESTRERLQLQEQMAQLQGIEPQLVKLRAQVEGEGHIRVEEQRSAQLSLGEATSREREAETQAAFAEHELERMRDLNARHLIPARDFDKAEAEARQLRQAVNTLKAATSRIPEEQAGRGHETEIRMARLQGEIATLESQRNILQATTERLRFEISSREITSPADGQIGESLDLPVGTVVAEGTRLASIVPDGKLFIVAQYPARAALGRIHPGQPATLRLDGFPWTEFGTVRAAVATVGREARDGKIRVELVVRDAKSFRGVLEHGMPGVLEVTVERVSPWSLALRAAGQWLTQSP
jgi:multidrug resistance efflux pump